MVQTLSPNTSGDKYLLVKGVSGLGNRMECLLTAILYARLSRRKLIVDWRDRYYSNDGTNAFEHYFDYPAALTTDATPITDSVAPQIWRGQLAETAATMRSQYGVGAAADVLRLLSIDPGRLNYAEEVAVFWTYTQQLGALRPYFVNEFSALAKKGNQVILRKLLRDDLRLHPDIRKRVDEFKSTNFVNRTVGVHVRYTDHRVALTAILRKLNELLKHEKKVSIFLCTDNLQIKRMFDELYPGTITTPHWYPERPGVTLHNHRTYNNLLEMGAEALIDLYLLAECDFLVIDTSSSFARMAALLTTAPQSCVLNATRRGKLASPIRTKFHRLMLKAGFYGWGLELLTRVLRLTTARPAQVDSSALDRSSRV